MEGIIRNQLEGKNPDDVIELSLNGWKSKSFTQAEKLLLEQYENLDSLFLNDCGLEHLENFPNLPNLVRVDLKENKIKTGLAIFKELPDLIQLDLSDNRIENIEEFKHLRSLNSLVNLIVEGNPVTNATGYREKIFEWIPSLQAVDGLNKEGEEVDFEDDDDDEEEFEALESGDFSEEDDDDDFSESEESEEVKPRTKGAQRGKKK